MRRRLMQMALALYPIAFRRRYGDELQALLEDEPPRLRATADLLRGALAAHLRPLRGAQRFVDPADRVRASGSGVLLCWVFFAAAGFAFYKTTEDAPFSAAGHVHPLLAVSHVVVQAAAVVASLAVVAGALPLVAQTVVQGARTRSLGRLVLRPLLPVLAFAALTALLVALAHAMPSGRGPTAGGSGAAVAWGIAGLACGLGCVIACRSSLFAVIFPPARLRFAIGCGAIVVAAMGVIALATAAYALGLGVDASSLAGTGNGPFQLLSVEASLALQVLVMVVFAALAAVACARGARGAHALRG